MKNFFWFYHQKKVFCVFFGFGEIRHHVYSDFQGFCPDFQQIKTFASALALPSPPPLMPMLC